MRITKKVNEDEFFKDTIHDNVDDEDVSDQIGEIDENNDADYECDLLNVFDSLDAAEDSEAVDVLPPHKLCGNHNLNLLASVDSLQARNDKLYKRSYDRVMAKVQALSNSVNRSPKLNDIVEEISGSTFLNPTATRWSSSFYAVQRVVIIGLDKVRLCQAALKQEPMTEADMHFLASYAKVMKPIVIAIDVLQGEKTTYLGHLIPTIIGLRSKLEKSTDKLVAPLVEALTSGIKKRFQSILTDDEHLIASVLLPQFKLNFLLEDEILDVKRKVLTYVQQLADETTEIHGNGQQEAAVTETSRHEDEDDLYSFMNKEARQESAQQRTGRLSWIKIIECSITKGLSFYTTGIHKIEFHTSKQRSC